MGKISNTFSLMGASWEILKKDREILVFQLISGICCLIILSVFLVPLFKSGALWEIPGKGSLISEYVVYYGKLYILFISNYFIIIFFNVAIVHCAIMRMDNEDPTLVDGMTAAISHLSSIVGWALISATVGLILRIVEDRSEFIGKFVASLIGSAWTIASFLVIPIMVVEEEGPVTALTDSASLLKKTWGEQLIGSFSFGLVFFLLGFLAIIPALFGYQSGTNTGMIMGFGLAIFYLAILGLIQSTLQSIFQAALYLTVRYGEAPDLFQSEVLSSYHQER